MFDYLKIGRVKKMKSMGHHKFKVLGSLSLIVSTVFVFVIYSVQKHSNEPNFNVLEDAESNTESLRHHLRASSDSIAYSCGGKEVAETCMLGTETCLASMQKKIRYTVRQSMAQDMATCSCFQANGCSTSCNAAMMSIFGGYLTVASCPLDFGSVYSPLSSGSPYDFYGEDPYGFASFANPQFRIGTVGAMYRDANAAQSQMLNALPKDELVVEVPTAVHMMRGRKI